MPALLHSLDPSLKYKNLKPAIRVIDPLVISQIRGIIKHGQIIGKTQIYICDDNIEITTISESEVNNKIDAIYKEKAAVSRDTKCAGGLFVVAGTLHLLDTFNLFKYFSPETYVISTCATGAIAFVSYLLSIGRHDELDSEIYKWENYLEVHKTKRLLCKNYQNVYYQNLKGMYISDAEARQVYKDRLLKNDSILIAWNPDTPVCYEAADHILFNYEVMRYFGVHDMLSREQVSTVRCIIDNIKSICDEKNNKLNKIEKDKSNEHWNASLDAFKNQAIIDLALNPKEEKTEQDREGNNWTRLVNNIATRINSDNQNYRHLSINKKYQQPIIETNVEFTQKIIPRFISLKEAHNCMIKLSGI